MRIHVRKYVCSSLLKLSITNQLPFTFIVLLTVMSKKGKYMHQSSQHWGFQFDFQSFLSCLFNDRREGYKWSKCVSSVVCLHGDIKALKLVENLQAQEALSKTEWCVFGQSVCRRVSVSKSGLKVILWKAATCNAGAWDGTCRPTPVQAENVASHGTAGTHATSKPSETLF